MESDLFTWLITGLVVWTPSSHVQQLKCPWVTHWTPGCSQATADAQASHSKSAVLNLGYMERGCVRKGIQSKKKGGLSVDLRVRFPTLSAELTILKAIATSDKHTDAKLKNNHP